MEKPKHKPTIFIIGEETVKTKFFLTDHTHTTEAGAILNAGAVTEGIKSLKDCQLSKYLNKQH